MAQVNLPAMLETWVQPLEQEDPLEKETATHCSIPSCRIPQMKETSQLMGLQRVGHD